MTIENNAMNLTVLDSNGNPAGTAYNQYGPRGTQDGLLSGGHIHKSGSIYELVVYAKAADFTIDDATNASFVTQFELPAAAVPIDCLFEVGTAITQTGGITSTTLNIGTSGSEGTNGFTMTEAATSLSAATELDAVGEGTWLGVSPVHATNATAVGIQITMGGGTITSIDGCDVKAVIRYRKV